MFENNKYNEPVHEYLDCSIKDALAMLYSYYVRHNLSWVALKDLIILINAILGVNSLPISKHMFKKLFMPKNRATTHLLCSFCDKYLGAKYTYGDATVIRCEHCNQLTNMNTKYKKNYFLTLPIESQLVNAIKNNMGNGHLKLTPSESRDGVISDVHDAENFKSIKSAMGNTEFISLTWSTDGVVGVKAAKDKSLWPIQMYINEIDLMHRFKRENMLVAAFAFGKTPDMNVLMRPFIEEINLINRNGGLSVKFGDTIKRLMIVPAIFTADSVAKCYVLGKTQHNSRFGCPYCLHPGSRIPDSNQLKYCFEDNAADRTSEQSKFEMIQAYEIDETVRGYKSVSPIIKFEIIDYDVIWQIAIDKMHSIDLGVTRKIFNLLFDTSNRNEP